MNFQISLEGIQAARKRITGIAMRTPLVRFQSDDDAREIWLKLENLQPVGSFKIRGAASAMTAVARDQLRDGVVTASAGNMAQGVAWMARQIGVPCTVIIPEAAPQNKVEAIRRLGARTIAVPFADWWDALANRGHPAAKGHFVHPVADANVIAGNGTIGLEILEDLPNVDAVLVPFGGGGLSCGIAAAIHALRSEARVYGCEPATAAPLNASFAAGKPVAIERIATFVDGCGGRALLPDMWPLISTLLSGAFAPAIAEIAAGVRMLAERNKIVAEGAGAVAIAAALNAGAPTGRIVCIVSGGCIDAAHLATILAGRVP